MVVGTNANFLKEAQRHSERTNDQLLIFSRSWNDHSSRYGTMFSVGCMVVGSTIALPRCLAPLQALSSQN